MNPGLYLPDWNSAFNPGLDLGSVTGRFRLAQANTLRIWCQATAREWAQHAGEFQASVEQWAEHVTPDVRHAHVQDLLSRALNEEGGAAALPILLRLGASLLDPHPSFEARRHPMHVALQPSPRNAKVLGAVLACLPSAPFADGADPFPGWSREQALSTLFLHQFGQKAWERANALGLAPSPSEQAQIMEVWLRKQQRKCCTIALQEWGWDPEPTQDLMDGWWSAHARDEKQPDRLHAFDRQWALRFKGQLGFAPAIREMQEMVPLSKGASTFHLLKGLDNAARTCQRTLEWLSVAPLTDTERIAAQHTFNELIANVNTWQAGWAPSNASNGTADQQQLEAKVLRLDMDQQEVRTALSGMAMATSPRIRARL